MKLKIVQTPFMPCHKYNCHHNMISLVVVLLLQLVSVIICQKESDLELQLVQVLFRHGDRNPVAPYPTDPYKNETFWPEGFAQLTKRGKQQQFSLGKFLRKRYDDFLSADYSPYEIRVEASDVDRTLMSAEANLAGLYPPQDPVSVWNPSILWQPIPVHTQPSEYDNKLKMRAPCPKLDQVTEDFNKSPFMVQLTKENQELYDYLSNHSGNAVNTLEKVDFLYDVLHIENLYNYTLPEWTKKVFPGGQMYNLTGLSFKVMTYTHEMQRLRSGPLLKDLIHNMQGRVNGSLDRRMKMFMYSAHDTTVASLLNTLEVYDDVPPPYASCVILELQKNISSGQSFVRVYFRNETDVDPYLLSVPGCNATLCSFQTFHEIMKPKIPEDWESECHSGFLGLVGFSLGALILATFLSLLLIVSMLAMAVIRRKKNLQKMSYPYLHLQMEDEDA